MAEVDLAIIGSGSGNSLVTSELDDKQIAIIDHGIFGGTCLNVGCIPTKMFVYAAEVANTIRGASKYGIDATLDNVRWTDIRDRIFNRIDPISEAGLEYRRSGEPNTTAYVGTAEFVGPKQLRITSPEGAVDLKAEQIVIAAGSRPYIPEVITAAGVRYETSDTVMRIPELPESMIIYGGGFIGAEFAHVFSALGVDVRIITRGDALLRGEDEEISHAFTILAREQWTVELGATVRAARSGHTRANGEHSSDGVTLICEDGREVSAEMLLVATGRIPNGDRMNLEAAGIENEDGRVITDEYGRTNVEGIWALGDATNDLQLKHVANQEARAVAHNLVETFNGGSDLRKFDHRFVPAAVFTHPQIASVGLTETAAREAGYDVATHTQKYGDVAYGWAMEDTTGLVKAVGDRATGKLLGVHFMGPDASSLIQPAIQALSFDLPVAEMTRGQYWIHPALAEVLENALLGLGFNEE
ncbi:MAG TPA: mycothione reductase [Beutenbergiaceae bacterium]|nr:mycothione reductase [Beutenbergiaceae bacterium]